LTKILTVGIVVIKEKIIAVENHYKMYHILTVKNRHKSHHIFYS